MVCLSKPVHWSRFRHSQTQIVTPTVVIYWRCRVHLSYFIGEVFPLDLKEVNYFINVNLLFDNVLLPHVYDAIFDVYIYIYIYMHVYDNYDLSIHSSITKVTVQSTQKPSTYSFCTHIFKTKNKPTYNRLIQPVGWWDCSGTSTVSM